MLEASLASCRPGGFAYSGFSRYFCSNALGKKIYLLLEGGIFMENQMQNHTVMIDNREKTTITDIVEIDSFDEAEIRATLKRGAMVIKGEKLNIQLLDLQEGRAVIGGTVNSLMYVKVREKGEKSLLARIMK